MDGVWNQCTAHPFDPKAPNYRPLGHGEPTPGTVSFTESFQSLGDFEIVQLVSTCQTLTLFGAYMSLPLQMDNGGNHGQPMPCLKVVSEILPPGPAEYRGSTAQQLRISCSKLVEKAPDVFLSHVETRNLRFQTWESDEIIICHIHLSLSIIICSLAL